MNEEAKRLIIDCTYSGRGHQQAGQRWAAINAWLGLPIVVSSALLASAAGLNALLGESTQLTALLALLSAVLTATRAFFKPDEISEEHSLKGSRYIALRNQARLFREIEMRSSGNLQELSLRIKDLRDRYDALGETPPRRIPRWAYLAAKRGIEAGESGYENDPLWQELGE